MDFNFNNILGVLTSFNVFWVIVLVSFMVWTYLAIKQLRNDQKRQESKVKQFEKEYVNNDVMYFEEYDVYNGDDV